MTEYSEYFNVLRISREDAAESIRQVPCSFPEWVNSEIAAYLTDEDMEQIASRVEDALMESGFWTILAEVVERHVQKFYPRGIKSNDEE